MTALQPSVGEDRAEAPARLEIRVRTDAGHVAAFRRASGEGADAGAGHVPLTYPFCWLTLPEVRPALERMIGAAVLPVHEAQSFDYDGALALDADYRVVFVFKHTQDPERLTVNAEIATPQGETAARFETVLRLVPAGGAAGGR